MGEYDISIFSHISKRCPDDGKDIRMRMNNFVAPQKISTTPFSDEEIVAKFSKANQGFNDEL